MQAQSTTVLEEWRPVVGYEGWYSVSNLGRVRREKGGCGTRAGKILNTQCPSSSGYLQVGLSTGRSATQRSLAVHVLVAETFLGARPDGCGVNHLNGLKTDNRAANLEWATPKQNSEHAVAHGLMPSGDRSSARRHPESYRGPNYQPPAPPRGRAKGSRNGVAKLTEADVAVILASPETQPVLAARYGVAQTTISKIVRRVLWEHVVPADDHLEERNAARSHLPRRTRGQCNPSAKLTDENVRDILSSSLTGAALSRRYGVGQSTISRIRRHTHWQHVAP